MPPPAAPTAAASEPRRLSPDPVEFAGSVRIRGKFPATPKDSGELAALTAVPGLE